MADVDERENQEPEITSEENLLDGDDEELDLSLGLRLRPVTNYSSRPTNPKNILESSQISKPNGQNPIYPFLSKRDAQALRRFEAKKKRDFKKRHDKAKVFPNFALNDLVFDGNFSERCRNKDPNSNRVGSSGFGLNPFLGWGWNNNGGSEAAAGGFRPHQGQNGKVARHGEGVNGKNTQSFSSGSSSGVSDNYQSTSGQGGNSSDAGSHSSHSQLQFPIANVPATNTSQIQPCSQKPQLCSSSSNRVTEPITSPRQPSKSPEGATLSSSVPHPDETQPSDRTSSDREPISIPQGPTVKEAKNETGKPPKPTQQESQPKLLSQMPCVSATGNGPNGKTVTGFLYRYTKGEVTIVCVCHGASFTPAGFVEHAGGVDIEHPLRHIRVVPFALG